MEASAAESERLVPHFEVRVDGSPLEAELAPRVQQIRVSQDIDVADACFVAFSNFDLRFTTEPPVPLGAEIRIDLGYLDRLEPVFHGQIIAWTAEFPRQGPAVFSLRGYDRMHRLVRGRRTRTFNDMKDSDIAEKIASDAGLRAEVEDTGKVHDHVFQNNASDWDFLKMRARRIGYEVLVRDQTLLFRPPRTDESPGVELEWGKTLKSFRPRLSAARAVSEVVVQGWDPVKKGSFVGRAGPGSESSTMEGSSTGSSRSEETFGERTVTVSSMPVKSQEEADRVAAALYEVEAMEYLKGRGVAVGNPSVEAGTVIRLAGLGEKYSGSYYVLRADHLFGGGAYSTRFEVRTNSVGKLERGEAEAGAAAAPAEETQEIEVVFEDQEGEPISDMDYVLVLPDGEERQGTLGSDGTVRADNLPRGSVRIRFEGDESGGSESDSSSGGADSSGGGGEETSSEGGS
jgi:phage protein D